MRSIRLFEGALDLRNGTGLPACRRVPDPVSAVHRGVPGEHRLQHPEPAVLPILQRDARQALFPKVLSPECQAHLLYAE